MHTSLLGRRRRLAKGGQGLLQGSLAVLADRVRNQALPIAVSVHPSDHGAKSRPAKIIKKAPNREQAQVCNEVQPSLPALLGYSCIYLPRTLPQCDISHFQLIPCSFLGTHTYTFRHLLLCLPPNLSNKSHKRWSRRTEVPRPSDPWALCPRVFPSARSLVEQTTTILLPRPTSIHSKMPAPHRPRDRNFTSTTVPRPAPTPMPVRPPPSHGAWPAANKVSARLSRTTRRPETSSIGASAKDPA